MRSEQEMLELILSTARQDERVRAVIMNGSRANPNAQRDFFQDYDIVYVVSEVSSFKRDPHWIERFGELMILQLPDDMLDPPPDDDEGYAYLMQFMDGNRIDLSLFPLARLDALPDDSQSLLLLDKDGIIPPFLPASDRDYLPKPPTAKAFSDCCNEFWWVCPYVAKGLWREEILYAKTVFEQFIREQLMKMLTWYVGMQTQFSCSPGKFGKYLQQYLEPELWAMLEKTYADASYEDTWEALSAAGDLFRITAVQVAAHFGFDYPHGDDERVSAHLRHVRSLPGDAPEMY
jgi:aminoglycoside 6-adenylyltransferase